MIVLGIVVAVVLSMVVLLAVVVHRDDAKREDRRKVDPFHAETERLAAAGLLFEVGDDTGLRRGPTYYVTPAGEAALRSYRAAPPTAPRLLSFAAGGLAMPGELQSRIIALRDHHARKAAGLARVIDLMEGAGASWAGSLEAARTCHRYEAHCTAFWDKQVAPN